MRIIYILGVVILTLNHLFLAKVFLVEDKINLSQLWFSPEYFAFGYVCILIFFSTFTILVFMHSIEKQIKSFLKKPLKVYPDLISAESNQKKTKTSTLKTKEEG